MRFRICLKAAILTFGCLVCSLPLDAWALDGPSCTRLLPSGVSQGTTTDVTATGTFPQWPLQVWSDDEGLVWKCLEASGKLQVTAGPQTRPGLHWMRMTSPQGATSLRAFVVGTHSEVMEAEPNDLYSKPQIVTSLPVTLNGVLEKNGDVDGYQVELEAGQKLVVQVDAHRSLNSPLDAGIQIVSTRGTILAQNLDYAGLDPFLVFDVPRDGLYTVRVFGFPETPDSSIQFAGKDTFVYRLTLASEPYLMASLPMAVSTSGDTQVSGLGVGISKLASAQGTITRWNPKNDQAWVQVPGASGYVMVPVVPYAVVSESSDALAAIHTPPLCITGSLLQPKEVDRYRLQVEKDSVWDIQLESRSLGFFTDLALEIQDRDGKQVAQADDVKDQVDPRLSWKCPATGEYVLCIRDTFGATSEFPYYRLRVEANLPRYALTLAQDLVQGKVGEPFEIEVSIDRQQGFSDELTVTAIGLPPEIEVTPVTSEAKGDTSKKVKLKIKSSVPYQGPLVVTGAPKAQPDSSKRATIANGTHDHLWLSIPAADAPSKNP